MKGGRWTEKLELGLVKLYKKFRCLWMMSLPAYNDLDRRYAAYVKIVEALKPEFRNLTVPKVVYKIRDLRYKYCVELTKIERAAACGENYTPTVSWFQVIHRFLDLRFRTDERRDSHDALSNEAKIKYDYSGTRLNSSTCLTIYENRLKIEESKSTVGEFEESGNDAGSCANVCDRNWGCVEVKESQEVKKIEDPQHAGDFFGNESLEIEVKKKATQTLLSAMKSQNSESKNDNEHYHNSVEIGDAKKSTNDDAYDDEFDAFALSIGSQLKTMDKNLVKKLEKMILRILKEERIKSTQR